MKPTYRAPGNNPYPESSLYMSLSVSPIRVLVVEDETFIRMDAVDMLWAAGFAVEEAASLPNLGADLCPLCERVSGLSLKYTRVLVRAHRRAAAKDWLSIC